MAKKQDNSSLKIGTWPTAWGLMGGVMSPVGLVHVVLPHNSPSDLRDTLAWEFSGAQWDNDAFVAVGDLCRDYFNGKIVDFSSVPCDLASTGPFGRKVLATCQQIAYGQTRTYTALAELAGESGKARAVAQALGKNPIPLIIPCHRVIAMGGGLCGFSAPGGIETKRRMLDLETRKNCEL